jgi:hypothetical protein
MKQSTFAPDIGFCIKELESNNEQQFAVLEGSDIGHTITVVWRNNDPDKVGQCYEIRVARIEETYQFEPEPLDAQLIGDE